MKDLNATSVLITTSRMPFALDEIRKFGRMGHRVYAADTYSAAPGSHSKHVENHIETPSPRYDTEGFISALEQALREFEIEWLIPSFEDALFIARHGQRLVGHARVFVSPFEVLERLHNKKRFALLAREIGLRTPETVIAETHEDLERAVRELGDYFARPVYSRGGTALLTNRGPLADAVALDECEPTKENPWLVQEFVEGEDICTFGVAHSGRLTAHSTYVHPFTLRHSGGIAFESVDLPEVVDAVARIVEATDYTGQISVDFLRAKQGLVAIECNPRPTAGVTLLEDDAFVNAVLDPNSSLKVAPAGVRRHIAMGLMIEMVSNWEHAPETLQQLFSDAQDIYAEPGDMLPELYMFISHARLFARQLPSGKQREALLGTFFDDVSWDGDKAP